MLGGTGGVGLVHTLRQRRRRLDARRRPVPDARAGAIERDDVHGSFHAVLYGKHSESAPEFTRTLPDASTPLKVNMRANFSGATAQLRTREEAMEQMETPLRIERGFAERDRAQIVGRL